MEHFVRSSYPGSSRKTLRSLKRQRAGRISELTGDKNIPTYVLPLRGRYTSHSAQRKFTQRKSKNFGTHIEICSQSLHFFNKNAPKFFFVEKYFEHYHYQLCSGNFLDLNFIPTQCAQRTLPYLIINFHNIDISHVFRYV